MLSPHENRSLFKKIASALNDKGTLAVHDFVLNDRRTGPPQAAVFAVNMLVNTPGGNSYTLAEYREWLRRAGFTTVMFRRLSGVSDLLLARK